MEALATLKDAGKLESTASIVKAFGTAMPDEVTARWAGQI